MRFLALEVLPVASVTASLLLLNLTVETGAKSVSSDTAVSDTNVEAAAAEGEMAMQSISQEVEVQRAEESQAKYTADWESLDSRPLPKWYDEAKIGIFMHFGVYSVPSFQSEWFMMMAQRDKYPNDKRVIKFLKDNYPPDWTYHNFGPQLTMEFFDAKEWADMVADSGAKYLVFTSKHHDGYCNWPSTYSYGWNSMDVGPKRDVIGELKKAFDEEHPDLHFGLYYSLYEWFNPIYVKDRENNFTTREYVTKKMWPEMKELVTKYSPHVLWVDGDWETEPPYWGSKDIRAWLYNEAPSRDQIVTNDRWGIGTFKTHGDFYSGPDGFDPGTLQAHKWENAMPIDGSWGYRRNIKLEDLHSMHSLIKKVARAVSNGGNILINVGPTKEGTISPIFQERLRDLGLWLKANGEAIYATRPWTYQNDSSNGNVWYTKKGKHIYGIVLEWPEDDVIKLGDPRAGENTVVDMLGLEGEELEFATVSDSSADTGQALQVVFPSMSRLARKCGDGCRWGYVLRFRGLDNADRDEADDRILAKRKELEEAKKKAQEEEASDEEPKKEAQEEDQQPKENSDQPEGQDGEGAMAPEEAESESRDDDTVEEGSK